MIKTGRLLAAALAATFAFFAYGFLVHGILIAADYQPHPTGVYRSAEAAQLYMPFGVLGILAANVVFVVLYARTAERGGGLSSGARLGALLGIFMAGAHATSNFATMVIPARLAIELAISSVVEWTLVGFVVAMVYRAEPKSGGL